MQCTPSLIEQSTEHYLGNFLCFINYKHCTMTFAFSKKGCMQNINTL